jgi:MarR family transcriptional regulator for hemolysin
MLQYDFEESVGYWLMTAHHAYVRAFNARLAPHGITMRQAQVLGWLSLEGRLTQADLAARLSIEPPSLVGVLDRMERAGWVSRCSCPEDRRKKWIVPEPAAEKAWRKIAACGRAIRKEATAGMTEREVATLRKLLTRVRKNVDESAPVEAPQ